MKDFQYEQVLSEELLPQIVSPEMLDLVDDKGLRRLRQENEEHSHKMREEIMQHKLM